MPKKFFVFCVCAWLYLLFPTHIHASVVINEILPNPSGSSQEQNEFIELYNTSDSAVDISLFTLDDIEAGGSKPFEIPDGTVLEPFTYVSYKREDSGIALNNTGDTVRLVNKEGAVVDVFEFTSTTEDVSIGRSENGGGEFVLCQNVTENGPNNCSIPTATEQPTIQPTNTLRPSSTVKPLATKQPLPVKSGSIQKNTDSTYHTSVSHVYTPTYTIDGDLETVEATSTRTDVLGSFHRAFSNQAVGIEDGSGIYVKGKSAYKQLGIVCLSVTTGLLGYTIYAICRRIYKKIKNEKDQSQ